MRSDAFEELYAQARTARLERRYRDAIRICNGLLNHRLTARQKVVALEIRGICQTWQRNYRDAEADLTLACSVAETNALVAEHVHALTSLVRLRLRQHRGWSAAETVLPKAERLLQGRTDDTSRLLMGSVLSLYGVVRFHQGRDEKALEFFTRAEVIFDRYRDAQRELRNLRRMAYVQIHCGQRRQGWLTANRIIELASAITEQGDIQSFRLGHYLHFCCLLPWPSRWGLWVVRGAAGL